MGAGGAAGFAPGTLLMAGALTALTSAQGLLTAASKTDGGYAYDFATVPFLAELAKLGISYGLLERQRAADPASIRCTRDARTVALFIVPSIIYMFHNNVQVGAGGCLAGGWLMLIRGASRRAGRQANRRRAANRPPACQPAFLPTCSPTKPNSRHQLANSSSSSSLWTRPPTRSWAT